MPVKIDNNFKISVFLSRFGIILKQTSHYFCFMKRCLLFFLLFITTGTIYAQEATSLKNKALIFRESAVDFGKIPQGKPVIHYFEWKNNSSKPLSVTDVQASCGCTTPEWERSAVQPGQTAKIKVGYNAEGEGPFEKTILVVAGQEQTTLVIRGNVYPTPATSAPLNPSTTLFKQIN